LRGSGFTTTLVDVPLVLVAVVLFLLLGLVVSGGSHFVLVLPLALALASATVITMVLRDARPPRNPGVRQIPTDHLRRQMFMALRPRRPKPPRGKDEPRY
jgi:hypothetical protein